MDKSEKHKQLRINSITVLNKSADSLIAISGVFITRIVEKIKSYDSNGHCLGFFNKETITEEHKTEVKSSDDWYHDYGIYFPKCVLQIDFHFFIVPLPWCSTIDNTFDVCEVLHRSFGNGFSAVPTNRYLLHNTSELLEGDCSTDFSRWINPNEICFKKSSYHIENTGNNLVAIEVGVSEYLNRAKKLKLDNPEFAKDVDQLVRLNLYNLSAYYGIPVKKLVASKDKVSLLINRINKLKTA